MQHEGKRRNSASTRAPRPRPGPDSWSRTCDRLVESAIRDENDEPEELTAFQRFRPRGEVLQIEAVSLSLTPDRSATLLDCHQHSHRGLLGSVRAVVSRNNGCYALPSPGYVDDLATVAGTSAKSTTLIGLRPVSPRWLT